MHVKEINILSPEPNYNNNLVYSVSLTFCYFVKFLLYVIYKMIPYIIGAAYMLLEYYFITVKSYLWIAKTWNDVKYCSLMIFWYSICILLNIISHYEVSHGSYYFFCMDADLQLSLFIFLFFYKRQSYILIMPQLCRL